MQVHEHAAPGEGQDAQLTYVMIRIRRQSGEFGRWTGMAEHLGTAEKRSFADGDGLLRLIEEWSTGPAAAGGLAEGTNLERPRLPDAGVIGR